MNAAVRTHRLGYVLAAALALLGLSFAIPMTMEALLTGPLYLIGVAAAIGAWHLPMRPLRIMGFIVVAATALFLIDVGHDVLGLPILGICAALGLRFHQRGWLRILAGGLGFIVGGGAVFSVLNHFPAGPLQVIPLIFSIAALLAGLLLLVPGVWRIVITRDALAVMLLLTSFSLAVSGLLSFAAAFYDMPMSESEQSDFEGSAAYYAMMIDMLGMRTKDVIVSGVIPAVLAIWGVIRLVSARGYAPPASQHGTAALRRATFIALGAELVGVVIVAMLGNDNPLRIALPSLVEIGVLALWVVAVAIAWKAYPQVRQEHLPGNAIDDRSLGILVTLILTPLLGAVLEYTIGLVPFLAELRSFSG